jgi:RND family efflux transporter MFP subunit
MTGRTDVTLNRYVAALAAVVLLLAGAGGAYVLMSSGPVADGDRAAGRDERPATEPSPAPRPVDAAGGSDTAPLPDVTVPFTAEAADRAGIVVAPVEAGAPRSELRVPGVIEANAYRQVTVTPLVAGRVSAVSADLGQRVRRGQALANIYSPELAEAGTKYISARAMLQAHDRELQRVHKLVEIGAASRQELERIHAEHAAQTAAVESAKAQLDLLGVPAPEIAPDGSAGSLSATSAVTAPLDGMVLQRTANVGLNVDTATPLFTVADLSTVWVVGAVYEKDLSRVRVGTDAAITTSAYPGETRRGRISYIDPQVDPATRTARLRVEVANPRGDLRLGMYADVIITGMPGAVVPMVPRAAVQNTGARTVVYLADPAESGRFIEREVRLGSSSGEMIEVTSGVQVGDRVVIQGSFHVRAERERLGLRPPVAAGEPGPPSPQQSRSATAPVQTARIVVNAQGFEPARVVLRSGAPTRLTFVRTTDATCATEIVIPSLNIKRALPLNEPVAVEFTPAKAGEVAFACGMDMLKGVLVVQ